jgi:hypothetical protein
LSVRIFTLSFIVVLAMFGGVGTGLAYLYSQQTTQITTSQSATAYQSTTSSYSAFVYVTLRTSFSTTFHTNYTNAINTQTANVTTTSSTQSSSIDPIATGRAMYDQYDSIIITAASKYGLDPLILKSQVAQESFFDPFAVSPDTPCGQVFQNGIEVGYSYGLLQLTPACNSWFAHNADGSFDLTTNASSPQWANSAFNPVYNINSAALGEYENLQNAKYLFSGCTNFQYVYMSLAIYNAGVGSISSCSTYNHMASTYVGNILHWYSELSAMANSTDPYS